MFVCVCERESMWGGDCHDFAVDVVCVTVHEECS